MKNKYQPFWFSEAIASETQLNIRQLENKIQSDICIVGGGYTGLWTAINIKEKKVGNTKHHSWYRHWDHR